MPSPLGVLNPAPDCPGKVEHCPPPAQFVEFDRERIQKACVPFALIASARLNMKTIIPTTPEAVRDAVRETYGKIALNEQTDCCSATSACCDAQGPTATRADELGYKAGEVAGVPEGANLGLGCGNPQAIASLKSEVRRDGSRPGQRRGF